MLVSWHIFVMISAFVDPMCGPHDQKILKCDWKMCGAVGVVKFSQVHVCQSWFWG